MTTMRISLLAERSGVPASTLRFYEGAGLLPSGRTAAGYRTYGEDALDRLTFIGTGKRLGLTLEQISELLAVRETGTCAEVKADLRPRIAGRLAEATRRAAELAAFITFLRGALDDLDALPDRTGRCGAECGSLVAGRASAPVTCSLTGDEMAERAVAWREAVSGATRAQIPGGVWLTLPASRAAAIAALAAAEQECCPFIDFDLHLDGQALQLEVRAPAEAVRVLDGLFGPA
jgi:MerR family transcriptional regulator, copper efflux regulator